MTETKFIKMNIPSGKRILVTSDIHGHPELFRRLLDAAGFSDDDLLVIVGDIAGEGSGQPRRAHEVMRLTGKGNTVALMGNVDLARVDSILRLNVHSAVQFYEYLEEIRSWSHGIWDEMTSEFGVFCSSPEEVLSVKDRVLERFRTELDFISGLPTVLETQKYVFVHGGLRDSDIRANASRDARELLKYDDFMTGAPVFDKYVVAGHWPVTALQRQNRLLRPSDKPEEADNTYRRWLRDKGVRAAQYARHPGYRGGYRRYLFPVG